MTIQILLSCWIQENMLESLISKTCEKMYIAIKQCIYAKINRLGGSSLLKQSIIKSIHDIRLGVYSLIPVQ